jgi:NADH pyrophosphatase NudC (nudix superfamily)
MSERITIVVGPAVAGTVAEGESYEENIYREAAEEIGLTGERFQLAPKRLFGSGERRVFYQYFTLQLDRPLAGFRLQPDEVERVVWFSKTDLLEKIEHKPDLFVPMCEMWKDMFLS